MRVSQFTTGTIAIDNKGRWWEYQADVGGSETEFRYGFRLNHSGTDITYWFNDSGNMEGEDAFFVTAIIKLR